MLHICAYYHYALHLSILGKAFIDTIVYNYSLETENRIANFVITLQVNFALCNKKTSFLVQGGQRDHSFGG